MVDDIRQREETRFSTFSNEEFSKVGVMREDGGVRQERFGGFDTRLRDDSHSRHGRKGLFALSGMQKKEGERTHSLSVHLL